MRTSLLLIFIVTLMLPVTGQAIQVSGDQWGTWTPDNNPYNVVGEIHVPSESILVIEPGVLVNFRGHYKFVVDSLATLLAIGNESDSIYFTTPDTATGWHGVRFLYAKDTSQISYCHLEYGKAIGPLQPQEDRDGGAIYCYNCSPMISHNTIINNVMRDGGGGIACVNHTGVIESNYICNNVSVYGHSGYGGGIYCVGKGPLIRNNTICHNSANKGAGIMCKTETIIEGNVIEHNYTGAWGTGMGIHAGSDNIITNNRICKNSCTYGGGHGGGIACGLIVVTGNYICGNYAGGLNDASSGGGIFGSPTILDKNTIANNGADSFDGIAFGGGAISTISNCIIRDDFGGSSNITVEYSCIEGGWPGVGNIYDDPLFLGDFTVEINSPCIDAGDPDAEVPEHGGDRIDMGAFEFFQRYNGYLSFEGYPQVAQRGAVISWEVTLENPTPDPQVVDGWIDFSGPFSGTAMRDRNKIVQPGIWTDTVEFLIPEYVPWGVYTVKGRVGIFGEKILDSEVFDIEIIAGKKQARVVFY